MIGPNMTRCLFMAEYGFNGSLSESSGKDKRTGWLVGYPGEVWLNISHVGCTYLMNGYHNLISFCNHSCLVSMGGPTL